VLTCGTRSAHSPTPTSRPTRRRKIRSPNPDRHLVAITPSPKIRPLPPASSDETCRFVPWGKLRYRRFRHTACRSTSAGEATLLPVCESATSAPGRIARRRARPIASTGFAGPGHHTARLPSTWLVSHRDHSHRCAPRMPLGRPVQPSQSSNGPEWLDASLGSAASQETRHLPVPSSRSASRETGQRHNVRLRGGRWRIRRRARSLILLDCKLDHDIGIVLRGE